MILTTHWYLQRIPLCLDPSGPRGAQMTFDRVQVRFPPTARICGLPDGRFICILLVLMLVQAPCDDAITVLASDPTAAWEDTEGATGDDMAWPGGVNPIAGCCVGLALTGPHEVGVVTQHDAGLIPRVSSLPSMSHRGPPESAGR
jgi:hypothetical protein